MKKFLFNLLSLQLFAAGTNVHGTTGTIDANTGVTTPYGDGGLSADNKIYYSNFLIDNAEPELVHYQFGQKRPIPKNGGKTVEFRRYSALPKANTPLTEGVTPAGTGMNITTKKADVYQYGAYIELTDMLILTALDNNIVEATKLLGSQAGRTIDSVVRDVIIAQGTNVQYGEGAVSSRLALVGGRTSGNHYMTVDCIRRAARNLKAKNVAKINGSYVGIIHPDVTYDLMKDPEWQAPHQYCDPDALYEGEIGKIGGVRFVETSEAKIIAADTLVAATGSNHLTIASYNKASSNGTATVGMGTMYQLGISDELASVDADNLIGRELQLYHPDENYPTIETVTVVGVNVANKTVFLEEEPVGTGYVAGDFAYAANAGSLGRSVYCTLIIGENAYGVIDINGSGTVEHIIKQLGSAGTGDPINQRASVGWKAALTACVLAEEAIVRLETTSTYDSESN